MVEKTKAKEKKPSKRPNVAVEVPVATIRKTFAIKEPSAAVLKDYAAFLSTHHGKPIDEDRVVDGLLATLGRDRAFAAWLQSGRGN